ncbi:MAG: CsgG/HfaB family protein [Gemmatimonadota bacterium]
MPRAATRILALTVLAVTLGACAPRLPEVTPADIPRLEAAVRANPDDLQSRVLLGIAQYRSENFLEARNTLGVAVERGASEGAAFLFLGLASEEVEDWRGARNAYSRYIEVGRFDPLKEELAARLTLLVQREMEAEARSALARESELSASPPAPRSVAVLPFQLISEDESLAPLGLALADMVTTDLSLAQALQVLERGQIQALVRELDLTEAGYTDPTTGARTGRLLRAEHVVQGAFTTLGEAAVRFDTDILNTEQQAQRGTFSEEGQLASLFDVEKEIVFSVLDVLGVDLTPAERSAINDNRTESLQAFLAYGQGLEALDQSNYEEAAQFFNQALQLDPSFQMAQEQAVQSGQLERGTGTSTQQIAIQSDQEMGGNVQGTDDPIPSEQDALLLSMVNSVNPNPSDNLLGTGSGGGDEGQERNPTQESGGGEGVTQGTTFTILLRFLRPGS